MSERRSPTSMVRAEAQIAELKPQSLELKPKTRELKARAEGQERRAEASSYSIRSSFSSKFSNRFMIIIMIREWQHDWVCKYKIMKSMNLYVQQEEIVTL